VARPRGGGGRERSEPRGGYQGSASGPWRTSGELHPLSRPLNPRAVRLVRVRLPRSTVRPSIRSFIRFAYRSPSLRAAFSWLPARPRSTRSSDIRTFFLCFFFFRRDRPPDRRRPTVVLRPRGKRRGRPRLLTRRDYGICTLGFFGGSSPTPVDRPCTRSTRISPAWWVHVTNNTERRVVDRRLPVAKLTTLARLVIHGGRRLKGTSGCGAYYSREGVPISPSPKLNGKYVGIRVEGKRREVASKRE